jgi:thiol:disulfide interchange protein DsbD
MLALGCLVAALALAAGLGQVASVPAGQGRSDAPGALAAEPFSPARLEAARAAGRPVLVNMTAAWCITCLVNERMALSSTEVVKALADARVVYLKGDWTNRDPVVTDYLAGFGRNGVPLYVYYPALGAPRVLPQILTVAVVLDTVGGGVSVDSL